MHNNRTAQFLFKLFSVVILGISATTTFGFFAQYFPGLIPEGTVDSWMGQMISGVIGVILFDVACVIWLQTFLRGSETAEQRSISLVMTLVAFIGSALASVAYLGLTATGELELAATTKDTIGLVSLVVVIVGVILNFGSAQMHSRYSIESKEAVAEADRRDAIAQAEAQQAKLLDKMVQQSLREQFQEMAPQLAQIQAGDIVGKFYNQEMTKVDTSKPPGRTRRSTRGNGDPTYTNYRYHIDADGGGDLDPLR